MIPGGERQRLATPALLAEDARARLERFAPVFRHVNDNARDRRRGLSAAEVRTIQMEAHLHAVIAAGDDAEAWARLGFDLVSTDARARQRLGFSREAARRVAS